MPFLSILCKALQTALLLKGAEQINWPSNRSFITNSVIISYSFWAPQSEVLPHTK